VLLLLEWPVTATGTIEREEQVKSREEIMNMLEAFDLTGSFRDAGDLAGVSHHTVAAHVAGRDAREPTGVGPQRRERIIDPWMGEIDERVERSHAKIRADRAFDKLKALGFEGSERTVRRAEVEANCRRGWRRVRRPWMPEPGMWAQWDWGAGPVIAGRRTSLFCAWLAWSRFQVVAPTRDRALVTVIGCVDRAMRVFGRALTFWLTDNERTVTIDHVAGIAMHHPEMSAAITGSRWRRVCRQTRVQRRLGSDGEGRQGRSSAHRRQLAQHYTSWAELAEACDAWAAHINSREHRVTRRPPAEMLAEEQQRLHRLPETTTRRCSARPAKSPAAPRSASAG